MKWHNYYKFDVLARWFDRRRNKYQPISRNEDFTKILNSITDYIWSADVIGGDVVYRYYSPVVKNISGSTMTFTIQFNAELGIIESTLAGQFSLRQLHTGVIKAIAQSKETRTCRFLCDLALVSSEITIVDLYDFPKFFASQNLSRLARVAVLPPQSKRSKERADFFETVCVNRGYTVKIFEKREAAILWLLK